MEELVDILLPTYQTNLVFLKKQIDSILNQTYQNLHLYISDDDSQEKELIQVLQEYEKKDNRITLFLQKENIGYNKGFEFLLKQSTAKYISFCDHDDIWYPTKIEQSLQKIKEEKVDMVYVNCHQINEKDEIIQNNYFQYKNVPQIKGKNHLAITRCIGIGCSQMITKEVKEKMLPFVDSVIAHDWLAAFIANENKGITYIEEPLFGYRLHNTNVFGGRSLSQNLARWQKKHGKSYQSFLKYRKENVIDKAYLNGIKMCLSYCQIEEDKKLIQKAIKYYNSLEKTKFLNFHWIIYFKLLAGKNLAKKMLKEFLIFHLPIFSYILFLIK